MDTGSKVIILSSVIAGGAALALFVRHRKWRTGLIGVSLVGLTGTLAYFFLKPQSG